MLLLHPHRFHRIGFGGVVLRDVGHADRNGRALGVDALADARNGLFGVPRQGRLKPAVRNEKGRTVSVAPFDLIFDRKALAREVVNPEGELRKTRARVDAGVLHFDHPRDELVVVVHGDARRDFGGEHRNGFGRPGLAHRLLRAAGQNESRCGGDQREFFHDVFPLKPSCRSISSAGFPWQGVREEPTFLPFPALRL